MTATSTANGGKYSHIIYIGRFQPFHDSHLQVLNKALSMAERVIVVIGSSNQPRTTKNPWTAQERIVMIHRTLEPSQRDRVQFVEVGDRLYNDNQWVFDVQRSIETSIRASSMGIGKKTEPKLAIIGHVKDDSSFYLKMFPQWDLVEVGDLDGLHSTGIRNDYFSDGFNGQQLTNMAIPAQVTSYLSEFRDTDEYAQLVKEAGFIASYKKAWESSPYPPTFVTVDAVVVHSGHILLVRRRSEPGKGLWALPGGFVNQSERLEDAVLRELREETRLKLPAPVLKGSIKTSKVFDHPNRSARGRTITHAFYFEFPYGELPSVRGADDADKAKWVSLAKFYEMEPELFEDHFHIVSYFLGAQ